MENEKKQKKRVAPSVLTEEQKQLVVDEMSGANLGLLCNVCGKIFKSRDALDFHIMYTKLPGHDVLQQQRVKNNYAQEAMRISAKLSNESTNSMPSDYGPPTPVVNYDPPTPITNNDEVFDSKTGIFVKREETEDHVVDQGKLQGLKNPLFLTSSIWPIFYPKTQSSDLKKKFGLIQ